MRVYIAWVQIADWESIPENIGVYSSREKAKQAILNRINNSLWSNGKDMFLSLEAYDETYQGKGHEAPYDYEIEEFELDK